MNSWQHKRILILSANVGEGHAAAARALTEKLTKTSSTVEVTTVDGLETMGRFLRWIIQDGYRNQLRFAPWSYSVIYWLLEKCLPIRWLVKQLLCRAGSRQLAKAIIEYQPEIVVSTYPAITVVLSHLRRRRKIKCPVVATITDVTGLFFWAQKGIDQHLVMYENSIAAVEKIAGSGSVQLVEPLIGDAFFGPLDPETAKQELSLPSGKMILVSGGGWGAGKIEEAMKTITRMNKTTTVICLTGRNETLKTKLSQIFADNPQVRIYGFTTKMYQLLTAADVLVHSTGGVTCLEAAACQTPVISYGLPVGHAKINTTLMARLGLLSLANTTTELKEQVKNIISQPPRSYKTAKVSPSAADVVLGVTNRVSPLPRWRIAISLVSVQLLLLTALGIPALSTDTMTALGSIVLRDKPIQIVKVRKAEVGIIVRVEATEITAVAAGLRARKINVSLADSITNSKTTITEVTRSGEQILPSIPTSKAFFRWISTDNSLTKQKHSLGLDHCFFLEASNGLTFGQLLMAKLSEASPIKGNLQLNAASPLPLHAPKAGSIIVIGSSPSTKTSVNEIVKVVAWLKANHLQAKPVDALLGS